MPDLRRVVQKFTHHAAASASRPVTVLNAHEGLALMVWRAATAAERRNAMFDAAAAIRNYPNQDKSG